jgi:hypothetical protein
MGNAEIVFDGRPREREGERELNRFEIFAIYLKKRPTASDPSNSLKSSGCHPHRHETDIPKPCQ